MGHPELSFNGLYRKVSEHKGWPVLKNASDKYCYYFEPLSRWYLSNVLSPEEASSRSYIGSKEGPLPSGSQTWRDFQSGKFVDEQLSVSIRTI
eukprot:COSAG06_NODE_19684_length_827_cov_0.556319_1_plen_93_part_10